MGGIMSKTAQEMQLALAKKSAKNLLTAGLIGLLEEHKLAMQRQYPDDYQERLYREGQDYIKYMDSPATAVVDPTVAIPVGVLLLAWSFYNGSPTGVTTAFLILGIAAIASQVDQDAIKAYINKNWAQPAPLVKRMTSHVSERIVETAVVAIEAPFVALGTMVGLGLGSSLMPNSDLGDAGRASGAVLGATAAHQAVATVTEPLKAGTTAAVEHTADAVVAVQGVVEEVTAQVIELGQTAVTRVAEVTHTTAVVSAAEVVHESVRNAIVAGAATTATHFTQLTALTQTAAEDVAEKTRTATKRAASVAGDAASTLVSGATAAPFVAFDSMRGMGRLATGLTGQGANKTTTDSQQGPRAPRKPDKKA